MLEGEFGSSRKARLQKIKELDDVDVPTIRNAFKNGILKACHEVCGKKAGFMEIRDGKMRR